jgi:hypothetical protein
MSENQNDTLLGRDEFLRMLQAAVNTRSTRFFKEAATHWLAVYPGDLAVRLMLAKAMNVESRSADAEKEISAILAVDPLYLDAYRLFDTLPGPINMPKARLSSILFALDGNIQKSEDIMPWAITWREASEQFDQARFEEAMRSIQRILDSEEYPILIACEHMRLVRALQGDPVVAHLAQIYADRWQDCELFKLTLADALMKMDRKTEGMDLLQQCVTIDPSGQVVMALWGAEHPYRNMWPQKLEVILDLAVPAEVAATLGSNKLGGGFVETEPAHGLGSDFPMPTEPLQDMEPVNANEEVNIDQGQLEEGWDSSAERADLPPEYLDKSLKKRIKQKKERLIESSSLKIQNDEDENGKLLLQKIAKKLGKGDLAESSTRFPVYVVLSSRTNLIKAYGEKTAEVIEGQMSRLAETIKKRPGWSALVFLPDDQTCMDKYNLKAIDTVDPWNVKLALSDLDNVLVKKGEMIGALLIAGGDEIIPFHRLPNPTNDADVEVLSDNPYSTPESNYFIPMWMTGRFPSEMAQDAGLLLSQIRKSIRYHELQSKKHPQWALFWRYMNSIVNTNGMVLSKVKYRNVGYTAAVWRRSSLASFRPIGEGRDMFVSPPESTMTINKQKLTGSPIGYYNLHGLADSAEWYGQKDPNEKKELPDFPVAMTPADLDVENSLPKLVFSEACYGAYAIDKTENDSIALKFVSRGVIAFIGSTCVSYGSLSTPLISADLLGNIFWKFIKEGLSTGEALMKAKIELVREMNKRQGFLDGEDQKTLLSFLLYGDPLVCKQISPKRKKAMIRTGHPLVIKVVNDTKREGSELRDLAGESIAQAKELLADFLPGLSNAQLRVFTNDQSREESTSEQVKDNLGKFVQPAKTMNRNIVVFSKEMTVNNHNLTQYARLTVDNAGKLVKISVSR